MTERPAEIEQMLQARRLERVSANPDAARKALAAVLAHHGLRVRPVGGAHVNTGAAAAAYVSDDALAEFDWMRQVRNSTEYPDISRALATKQDVQEAIAAASATVAACPAAVDV